MLYIDAGVGFTDLVVPTIARDLAAPRSMTIRVADSAPATVRLT